jgi:Domain of unknown function (DUF4349)
VDSEFEILRRFEAQLARVAERDARRAERPPPKRHRPWKAWLGATAALLAISLVVGLLATGGGLSSRSSASSAAAQGDFQNVGSAVGSAPVPAASGADTNQSAPRAPVHFGVGDTPDQQAALGVGQQSGSTTTGEAAQQGQQPQADLSKIIRDGQIAVTIDDGTFKAKAGSVAHIAAVNGGSILSSSTEGGDSGSFTLRIPSANFDKAMVQLAQLGTVDSSASQGQDVTAQYVDLQAHRKIYLSRRKVLFGLMSHATTIGQTLTLQNQLDQVQLKIDQITGQLNYIQKQVAESTIKVDLHEPGAAAAESPDAIDHPSLGRAWDRAVQGFFNILAATVIGLGYLIPLLLLAGIVFLVVRLTRRRRIAEDEA